MALDVVTTEYNIEIEKSKQALNDLEKSYQKSEKAGTASAGKVTGAFQKTAGILENLNAHLQSLEKRRDKAMNPSTIQIFNKRIDETRAKIAALTQATEKSGGSMVNTFKQVAASVGIAFSVQTLLRFGKEMVNLALNAEEVKTAFENLNNKNILNDVKDAVSGTLDEVTLMSKVLKAESLNIPLEKLPKLFEYAERQAGNLGTTTEALIDSILNGIGSRSRGAFNAMGVDVFTVQKKMEGLNFETASIADVTDKVLEIFDEKLVKMGANVDSNSDKVARLSAQWVDFKTKTGGAIISVLGPMVDLLDHVGGLESVLNGFINTATGGMIGLGKTIGIVTKSSAADIDFLAKQISGLANQLSTEFDIPEEFKVDVFKDMPKSIDALNEDLAKLKKAFGETESLQQRAQLLDRINTLTDEITIATGGETEAMKASRAEREKQNKAAEEFNKSLTSAKKNLVEFFRLLPIMQDAADAVSGAAQTSEDLEKESDDRKKRITDAIREARAALQLSQDTVAEKIKLLQFERDQELKNTELTESERLLIIKKYRDLEKQLEDQAQVERVQRVAQTISDITGIAAGLNDIITEIGNEKLQDQLDLIDKQREAQLSSLDKQLENEKLTAKQREDLLKQRSDLEAEFARQTEAAREEAAKKQLKFTIAGIVLNQSAAIASAIAGAVAQAAGNPLGIAAILAITLPLILSGMAQALSAANAVELAEGEVGLKGPGTTKSDSIPARLSRGESVITAEGTKLDPDLLRAMNKGSMDFENYIQHTYVWPYMEAMIKAHSKPERGFTFNDRNLLKELKTGNKLQIKSTNALLRAMYRSKSYRGERN